MARVVEGEHAAFALLYDALGSLVYGISLKVLHNSALAQEVTQETFMQVWLQASRFDSSRGQARPWVATIAHRRAIDLVRREQSAANREERITRSVVRDYDITSETAELHEEQERVRACLFRLTPLQLESVNLAYYGGLTYMEVSEHLGVNNGTVKTRIRDGLGRLRLCLEP